MTSVTAPICLIDCKHFNWKDKEKNSCLAFPDGIPKEILISKVTHDKPYPGDRGIQYEPKDKE
jgi:hypothetical protein